MARSALINGITGQDNSHLALLPFKYARIYQPSSNEISGKVQQMPHTGNTSFSPGSPNRCSRGLDREKYVKGEKFFRPAGVGYLFGDSSKMKQVFGWGPKVKFEEILKMMVKADVERLIPK